MRRHAIDQRRIARAGVQRAAQQPRAVARRKLAGGTEFGGSGGGGRVWGYDNLYVADNSVIGSSNSGNPTFMMVAQALRTADRILAR